MKKAEEYLKLIHAKDFNPSSLSEAIKLAIRQAQIDAIKETCERCANEAEMTGISYGNDKSITDYEVDKNSIISVADILIKELEDGNKN